MSTLTDVERWVVAQLVPCSELEPEAVEEIALRVHYAEVRVDQLDALVQQLAHTRRLDLLVQQIRLPFSSAREWVVLSVRGGALVKPTPLWHARAALAYLIGPVIDGGTCLVTVTKGRKLRLRASSAGFGRGGAG